VCVNGGWLPPGLAPGGEEPPPPPPPSEESCTIPDPFAGVPGLIGICLNGDWIPTEHLEGGATLRFHSEEGGFWALHLDDDRVFVPLEPLDPSFEIEGLRVTFSGKVRSDVTSPQGNVVEIITIAME
jgi:hypothetical protein